ncbi:MAG: hypothetical protein ABFE13_00925 [Phycisphaerales bacterium]
MDRDSTRLGLNPDQLSRLWNIGDAVELYAVPNDSDQAKTEFLRDVLVERMPLEPMVTRVLSRALSQACEGVQPFPNNSYGLLLADPATDVTILTRVKDHAKELVRPVHSEGERQVLAAVYYAAIACALIYHDRRISSFSFDCLAQQYKSLLEQAWLTSDLRDLFEKAKEYCDRKNAAGAKT